MHLQPGIVFYDLEWSGSEIVQVGAVVASTGETFNRTIVPQRNIQSKVSEKIQLYTQEKGDGSGERVVLDMVTGEVVPSLPARLALHQLLVWLLKVRTTSRPAQLILVSHGTLDISVLHANLTVHGLDEQLLDTVTQFLDLQAYIRQHWPGLPLALADLLQKFIPDHQFRLHSALDDAKAAMAVFFALHSTTSLKEGPLTPSTQLVRANIAGAQFCEFKRIKLSFVSFEPGAKEICILSSRLNPSSEPQYVETLSDWVGLLSKLPLFRSVDPPGCFMFYVQGWVTHHHLVERDGAKARTEIRLLCFLGQTYFSLQFYPDQKASYMGLKRLLLHFPTFSRIPAGSPVTARLQLRPAAPPRVMYITGPDQEHPPLPQLEQVLGQNCFLGQHVQL